MHLRLCVELSGPYRLASSGNELVVTAVVVKSSMPSFPVGTVFEIRTVESSSGRNGWVWYILPTWESGGQSPTTVEIN